MRQDRVILEPEIVSRAYHYYKNNRSEPNEFTIIQDSYKYIFTPGTGRKEFYDLQTDPGETVNLEKSRISKRLDRKLRKWMEENRMDIGKPSEEAMDADRRTRELLEKLGYL